MSGVSRCAIAGWRPEPSCHATPTGNRGEDFPPYKAGLLRSPGRALIAFPNTISEITGPVFGHNIIGEFDNDMLCNFARPGESPIGERIIVHGQVLDENGRPVPGVLVEVWQANAGGRYRHKENNQPAPIDQNFAGCGRCITDATGRYQFRTIRPGAYPLPHGFNVWRPSHIHFSVFGNGFAQRLVTQMYFEGDPLISLCSIVQAIRDKAAIASLVALLDMENSTPMDALAYRFDVVLRGRRSTVFENRMEGN